MYIPMIDMIIATIDIKKYEEVAKDLLIKLEDKKNEAKLLASQSFNNKTKITINNITFEVLANGSKGYAYILHNNDYEVKLSQFRSKSEDFYPVFVKIKSESLWANGPKNSWIKIIKWIRESVGTVLKNKINRLDLCCHTDELELNENDYETFKGNFHNDQIYRFRRKVNAMVFGSRDSKVYCRIYNKTLETRQSNKKTWFFDIWKNKGLNPEKVWNVEFEIKRHFLKDKNIDSVEDAFLKIGAMWVFCTKKWITKVNLDCTRIERCSTNEIWTNIQNTFSSFKEEKLISRERQLQTEALALIPGTIGNLTSFAARLGNNNIDEAISNLKVKGHKYLKAKNMDFSQAINKKIELLNLIKSEV